MHWQTKKILDDIIDVAYANESEQRRKYFKWFTIELETKESRTFNGSYNKSKKIIRIVNLNHDTENIIKTCIHELAHHIDFCKHNSTGHQEPFYEEYKTLLYAALNMRVFSKDHLFDNCDSQDYNKVKKIVNDWVPEYIDYKLDKISIKAVVPFDKKDLIKSKGYCWNNIEKTWEKEIDASEQDEEVYLLKSIGCEVQSNDASSFTMDAIGYIVTDGNSYQWKDILKENGFFYSNKKCYKKINVKMFEDELRAMLFLTPELRYKLVNKVK